MLGTYPQLITEWEKTFGALHSAKSKEKSKKYSRLFTQSDIDRLKKIISLKETGWYTNKGIKHFIS